MTARKPVTQTVLSEFTVPKISSFTITQNDDAALFNCTAPLTVTVPGGVLANGFTCTVVNDSGGSVIIDGPGVTDITLTNGQVATIYQSDGTQRVTVDSSTVIGDFNLADRPWDPTVFGTQDLIRWWDATTGITLDPASHLVKSWSDKIIGQTANQADTRRQSTWPNTDELRMNGVGKAHNIGTVSRANFEFKWLMMLLRFNWTAMATTTDQSFFLINGQSNAAGQKQPQLRYLHATHQLRIIWHANDGDVSLTVDVPGADDTWHSFVFRRDDDGIYGSVDGAAETSFACYPRAFLPTGSQPIGYFGNGFISVSNPASTIVTNLGFDSVVFGQREISPDEIAAAHAWMLWKRGAEASLDPSSPYLLAAPMMSLADVHVAEPDSYATDGFIYPASGGWDDTVRGTALDLSGFTRTFHDHFTTLSTITDGLVGEGPWYAPAHIDTSGAKFRSPTENPLDTWTLLPDNTTLQIKIQKLNTDPLSKVYASGHMQTVDCWRNPGTNGFLQSVPTGGASYFEARMAFNGIGTDVDGNIVDPAPSWPSFWLYSPLDAKDSAATKMEIDIIEAYGDRDPSVNEIHIACHRHSGYRPQPGNAGAPGSSSGPSHTPSKIVDVTQPPWNVSPSLFDGQGPGQPGQFHTYGCMIDETWTTFYFDGLIVSRFVTCPEALGPLFMLLNLQSQDLVVGGIPGQGGGTPNCTSYLWVDYVDAWVHT